MMMASKKISFRTTILCRCWRRFVVMILIVLMLVMMMSGSFVMGSNKQEGARRRRRLSTPTTVNNNNNNNNNTFDDVTTTTTTATTRLVHLHDWLRTDPNVTLEVFDIAIQNAINMVVTAGNSGGAGGDGIGIGSSRVGEEEEDYYSESEEMIWESLDENGNTLVHSACLNPHTIPLEVVEILVDGFPNSMTMENHTPDEKFTPIHAAIQASSSSGGAATRDDDSIVLYLLDKFPWLAEVYHSKYGTLLHFVCSTNNNGSSLLVLQKVLELYPEATRIVDPIHSNLPLWYAVRKMPLNTIRLLVETNPDSVRYENPNTGVTILQRMTTWGDHDDDDSNNLNCNTVEVAAYLIEQYPQALQKSNRDGWIPLTNALKSLESKHLQPGAAVEKSQQQQQPAAEAMASSSSSSEEAVKAFVDLIRLLVQHNPTPLYQRHNGFQKPHEGRTPLHIAVDRLEVGIPLQVIQFLIEAAPYTLLMKDSQNQTPRDIVVEKIGYGGAGLESSQQVALLKFLANRTPATLEATTTTTTSTCQV